MEGVARLGHHGDRFGRALGDQMAGPAQQRVGGEHREPAGPGQCGCLRGGCGGPSVVPTGRPQLGPGQQAQGRGPRRWVLGAGAPLEQVEVLTGAAAPLAGLRPGKQGGCLREQQRAARRDGVRDELDQLRDGGCRPVLLRAQCRGGEQEQLGAQLAAVVGPRSVAGCRARSQLRPDQVVALDQQANGQPGPVGAGPPDEGVEAACVDIGARLAEVVRREGQEQVQAGGQLRGAARRPRGLQPMESLLRSPSPAQQQLHKVRGEPRAGTARPQGGRQMRIGQRPVVLPPPERLSRLVAAGARALLDVARRRYEVGHVLPARPPRSRRDRGRHGAHDCRRQGVQRLGRRGGHRSPGPPGVLRPAELLEDTAQLSGEVGAVGREVHLHVGEGADLQQMRTGILVSVLGDGGIRGLQCGRTGQLRLTDGEPVHDPLGGADQTPLGDRPVQPPERAAAYP